MLIRNVVHRGLRRFIQRDDASGLPPAVVEEIRNILTFLQEMSDVRELQDIPRRGVRISLPAIERVPGA